ncbi:ABC transporter permease [candidate division KSB1 bacterium]|nr:ABC transporter permease [candidate division KSB1 bacterium]
MFQNYIKIAIRNVLKQKTYTLINIIGLTIGLTCSILILLWIQDELSIDRYHENRDQICQAYLKTTQEDQVYYQPTTAPVIATTLKDEYPEIREAARIGYLGEVVLKTGEKRIMETTGIAADPSILNIFTYTFIQGDKESALKNPESIILDESTARKYFGTVYAVGQVLRLNNQFDLQVTGVIKDLPQKTYRLFNFIVPFVFLKDLGYDIEGSPFFPCNYLTYVLTKPGIDDQNLSEKIRNRIFATGKNLSFEIILKPLAEAYQFDTGGRQRIVIFGLIAMIILGIVCINFINLTTARATTRAKEIGIRKVTGANPRQIAVQFLGETILLTSLATVFAVIVVKMLLNMMNQVTGKSIAINNLDPVFILELIGVITFTGLLAGVYPAIIMSRFKPNKVFKQATIASKRVVLRKVLIIVQFVFSIVFIIATLVISGQLRFLRNFNLGVNDDNILYIRMDNDMQQKYSPLKQELLKNSHIKYVTTASNLPVSIRSGSFYFWGKDDKISRRICETQVGYDFLETFGLEMAEGRFYSDQYPNDISQSIVVNETAIRTVGLDSAVGKPFLFKGQYYTLIGIIKDFHHNKTLRRTPDPLSFHLNTAGSNFLFIKINPALMNNEVFTETVNFIRKTCDSFSPERPLTYQFLNEFSFQFVQTQEFMRKILLYSSIVAIFVSCLGLFGLTAFLNEQRTKEIGIRKVLGATINNLLVKSSREFSQWIIIANVIAWPIAWFALNKWLQNFAYRITLGLWIFVLAGVLAFVISLLTISFHMVKAATTNPVEVLRYE